MCVCGGGGGSDGRRCRLFGGSLPNDTAGGIWRGERGKSPFVIPLRCTNDTKVGYMNSFFLLDDSLLRIVPYYFPFISFFLDILKKRYLSQTLIIPCDSYENRENLSETALEENT